MVDVMPTPTMTTSRNMAISQGLYNGLHLGLVGFIFQKRRKDHPEVGNVAF